MEEERQWTPAQTMAIETKGRTLLVSAAAGSGKTAVLTERIIRALTDPEHPADISRMLIVTFTRAAANQLRQKISSALTQKLATDPGNAHLSEQLMLLGSARISTIDSFYLDVVKANFQAAGFPPSFRIANEEELVPARVEIMNDVIDQMYQSHPNFSVISDIFCDFKNEENLGRILVSVAEKLAKLPQNLEALLDTAEELERNGDKVLYTPFGKAWLAAILSAAQTGDTLFDATLQMIETEECAAALQVKYGAYFTEARDRCRAILQIGDRIKAKDGDPGARYDDLRHLLLSPFATDIGSKRPKESPELKKRVILCKEFLKDIWKKQAPVWGANSKEEIAQSAALTAELLRLLYQTLSLYSEKVMAEKKSREMFEFSDISRAAYHLLVQKDDTPTPLAKEIAAQFDAVYIDEYQDVDAMQDATFRAIATRQNRFLVGDIKQSIYRFRGAQPTVFADYKKRFPLLENAPENAQEATIFMSNCFRCDENVIRFSNAVSEFLFSRNAESIGYTTKDNLVFSKKKEKSGNAKCRVLVLEPLTSKERGYALEGAALEAKLIAREIKKLLNGGKKADGTPIKPGDIAVLSRNTSHFAMIVKELNRHGIPCNDISKQSFFENPEVLCMYSLLAAIDNPFRDIYLAATLRSPFFGFTLEDLVKIRAAGDRSLSLYEALCRAESAEKLSAELLAKIGDFQTRFAIYRDKARLLSVDKLLRYLYQDTAVLAFAGFEEDGKGHLTRKNNLMQLYEYARGFESGGFKGLYQFIRYVDNMMANGAEMPQSEGSADAVLFSTIHKSKGLEFPVCFLASTQGNAAKKDYGPAFLADEHIGCALRLSNAGPFSRYETFFRRAVEMDLARQNREEEMRLLYVAMTRAIEQLIVTAVPMAKNDTLMQRAELAALPHIGDMAIGGSYLEWILAAIQDPTAADFVECAYLTEPMLDAAEADRQQVTKSDRSEDTLSAKEAPAPNTDLEILKERFAFRYPYEHLAKLPAKLSVSRLSPTVLDVFDSNEAPAPTLTEQEDAERLLHTFDRTPLFGKKTPSAAEQGTATHEFLQFCDFAKAELDVRAELNRLIEERFLSPETAQAVRVSELERFFESDFYRSLSAAATLYRETRFHIFLPAADFTEDPTFAEQLREEKLAVQGVIDLFYYNRSGELILCDYKTDRLTPYELSHPKAAAKKLSERHGKQLSYYAKALGEICGKTPDRVLIYSLPLGEAVELILPNA
ncbi:MAG: hypothetical protein E7585_05885 [Ruminococcaceae bacterium]|nr:hypothetical protein [Oscillospiraceae bacterium]